MINIKHAAMALGGEVVGSNSVLCPGPGHSPRDRSLSVTFNGNGFTVYSHAKDNWMACKDHVRERLGLSSFVPAEQQAPVIAPDNRDNRTDLALRIWRAAIPIKGTPAEAYLASRGLSYEGEELRWHPACPFGKGERRGCMIGLIRNVVSNEPQAIHRTAITCDGRKIGRKALGPLGGGAVKLTDDADVTTVLGIGEGIETALSIRRLPDLENMPVWSALNANGITAFSALLGIEAIWIAADNDESGTGQKASYAAAERLKASNIETIILAPSLIGSDINDKVARHA